ncbi:MAG: 50S ribosomal protein L5 [Bacteroidetes bacterium]|nr:50S ribosomal protein L5 [Bacteroidota bacterium]
MANKVNSKVKLHVKKGDTVKVLAGDDKGKSGKVLRVLPSTNRAVVEGLNLVTKHYKPSAQNTSGRIEKIEAPIHLSNLMVVVGGTATRVGRKLNETVIKKKTMSYVPRLQTKYKEEVVGAMMAKFAYKNHMQIPHIEKVVLNQGIGAAVNDKKLVDAAIDEMTKISGQKAQATFSKKDISNFKLRKNVPIGAKVTLRKERMYDFLDRLITVSLPRVRDFQGLNVKGFDGRGNFTMGITEQIIFPEIDIDKVNKITGMDITIVTSAKTDEECLELLKFLGFPFKKK